MIHLELKQFIELSTPIHKYIIIIKAEQLCDTLHEHI